MRSRDSQVLADEGYPVKRHFLIMVALMTCLGHAATAGAWQDSAQRVEETIADVGPLSGSLRNMSVDLRQPLGFEGVYRLSGKDGKFMRVNGGLYAVFPRSLYNSTKQGQVATIPDGTVFYIGPPPFLRDESKPSAAKAPPNTHREPLYRLEDRLDPLQSYHVSDSSASHNTRLHRSSGRSGALATIQREPDSSDQEVLDFETPTIVNNPSYREARIYQLMKKAADAVSARGH